MIKHLDHKGYRALNSFLASVAGMLFPIAILLAVWANMSSSDYLRPIKWTYVPETERVLFVRDVLRGPAVAEWVHEITLNDGTQCSASGRSPYSEKVSRTVTFPVPPSLLPCLQSGQEYVQNLSWTVLLWDVVPLRPVKLIQQADAK